ncbi:putative peptidyl-tRNA hydrolase 2 [Orchesella cincta]|uniref:peptidyl-tRNA hydrolase n=1 Tax=Orchesella cincta TaxID=48709 RepID=A0A1D2MEA1_ORCCI|nr:putative peptidyl-tRNA hydrolase 2 [Orchesella cincta]
MEDKSMFYWGLGSAVVFGVGFVSGIVYRKIVAPSKSSEAMVDTFARAARLTAIRAKGLGRNHKMVFVVRTDLGMGKGKIAAQCCHAAVMCYQKAMVMDTANLDLWEATGAAKICLKADGNETNLLELKKKARDLEIMNAVVRDAGHTQVDPGTITVLGLGPAPVTELDKVTGHLKLL